MHYVGCFSWARVLGYFKRRREEVLAQNSTFCCTRLYFFPCNCWIISNIMKLLWEGVFSILLTTTLSSSVLCVRDLWVCEGKKTVSAAFHLAHLPQGAFFKCKCGWVCMHSQVSPQDPVESPPTQRVMNVGPLRQPLRVSHYGSALSQPSLPVFTSLYGRPHWVHKTGTPMAHWAASVPPPAHIPIKQFHIIKCDDPLF